MSKFRPMLCPNDEVYTKDKEGNFKELIKLSYAPYYFASLKLDGYRVIFKDGEMLTRNLKLVVNKQIREKFQPLMDFTKDTGKILDGEMYAHDLTFQEIGRYCRTSDFKDPKVIKKHGKILEIPETLKFHIFDFVDLDAPVEMSFIQRIACAKIVGEEYDNLIEYCDQYKLFDVEDVKNLYSIAMNQNYEGLILKHPHSTYKFGRATSKEASCFKVKPFMTFDAQITGIIQATEVDPNAEKKTNELGRSVTSKKKGDRIPIESVSGFTVEFNGQEQKVSCSSMTHKERAQMWKMGDKLIGKWIEYRGMLEGSKDLVRHPVFIRFRRDKD